mgnify:CR=1 FL=1
MISTIFVVYALFFRVCTSPDACSFWQRLGAYDSLDTCERALFADIARHSKDENADIERKCEVVKLPMDEFRKMDTVTE